MENYSTDNCEPYGYDLEKRLNTAKQSIELLMNEESDDGLEEYNINQNNTDFNQTQNPKNELKKIETKVDELEKDINLLKADGNENKFLSFEAQCNKLFSELDRKDFNDQLIDSRQGIRDDKRRCISRLNRLSEKIKEISLQNLKAMMNKIETQAEYKRCFLYNKEEIDSIKQFIDNNDSPSIRAIDDHRYKLEDMMSLKETEL